MEFQTRKIVFKESGENWGTLSPVCFLEDFTGNLEEETSRFVSWDFDMRSPGKLYKVHERTVFIIPDLFCGKWTQVQYAIALAGAEALQDLSVEQFYRFLELGEFNQYIYGRLYDLQKNEFCKSLLKQFVQFLDGKSKYQRPFSEGQYNALAKFRIYKRDAERISTRLYYSKQA